MFSNNNNNGTVVCGLTIELLLNIAPLSSMCIYSDAWKVLLDRFKLALSWFSLPLIHCCRGGKVEKTLHANNVVKQKGQAKKLRFLVYKQKAKQSFMEAQFLGAEQSVCVRTRPQSASAQTDCQTWKCTNDSRRETWWDWIYSKIRHKTNSPLTKYILT